MLSAEKQWPVYLALLIGLSTVVESKVFGRCEFANTLQRTFSLNLDELALWVCIAEHSSGFNTATQAGGPSGGSHGIFQISDVYWCSPPGKGTGCNIPCQNLRDDNIADDFTCAKQIYSEHQRISGDGYTAWLAYDKFCRNDAASYISDCFPGQKIGVPKSVSAPTLQHYGNSVVDSTPAKKGKIYGRCELARELYHKHKLPADQIPTWVCIAEHESRFDTSAVGRLNADGSSDNGLFQISDLYWCSNERNGNGKSCGLPCSKLLDGDITDDVRCIKRIHREHTSISGDGFTAWAVYNPHCRNQRYEQIADCFQGPAPSSKPNRVNVVQVVRPPPKKQLTQITNRGPKPSGPKPSVPRKPVKQNIRYTQQTQRVPLQTYAGTYQTNSLFPSTQIKAPSSSQYRQNFPAVSYQTNPLFASTQLLTSASQQYKPISEYDFSRYSALSGPTYSTAFNTGKVYTRCLLAHELYSKYNFPLQDIPTWVCLAEHISHFNTSAVSRLNGDGSKNYGLFQISDLYWCSHDNKTTTGGKACNILCSKLLDNTLADDIECIRIIYKEHQRISGDGFTAWPVYKTHCEGQKVKYYTEKCFQNIPLELASATKTSVAHVPQISPKKYSKCELAQELYFKHNMPLEQIPTWVCIAQHESSYNTAAVGRLNADDSADHGLFQISDLYWCSHDKDGGKACNIPCNKLLDADISDDVKCAIMIYKEHTRISGDGFNAWTVYKQHCRGKGLDHIKDCFSDFMAISNNVTEKATNSVSSANVLKKAQTINKSKIYEKCELAQELLHRHKMPLDEIATWVCIAKHESNFNTAAVGSLNSDGSLDHGLFQISDQYWCSHEEGGGKSCNIPCHKLLDSDISDDIQCLKIIYKEHSRIYGNGFTAWTVYKSHCQNQNLENIRFCFSDTANRAYTKPKVFTKDISNILTTKTPNSAKYNYANNPFLNGTVHSSSLDISNVQHVRLSSNTTSVNKKSYKNNIFLNGMFKLKQSPSIQKVYKYVNNPFLNGNMKTIAHNYDNEPQKNHQHKYANNPFLNFKTNSNKHHQSNIQSDEIIASITPTNLKYTKLNASTANFFTNKNNYLNFTFSLKTTSNAQIREISSQLHTTISSKKLLSSPTTHPTLGKTTIKPNSVLTSTTTEKLSIITHKSTLPPTLAAFSRVSTQRPFKFVETAVPATPTQMRTYLPQTTKKPYSHFTSYFQTTTAATTPLNSPATKIQFTWNPSIFKKTLNSTLKTITSMQSTAQSSAHNLTFFSDNTTKRRQYQTETTNPSNFSWISSAKNFPTKSPFSPIFFVTSSPDKKTTTSKSQTSKTPKLHNEYFQKTTMATIIPQTKSPQSKATQSWYSGQTTQKSTIEEQFNRSDPFSHPFFAKHVALFKTGNTPTSPTGATLKRTNVQDSFKTNLKNSN